MICLIQCAGLWFVGSPAKVSITWNLKQVIVRKPKLSSISDDTCFLTIRPTDLAALKASPQPEIEQTDHTVVSTLVEDSDDDDEEEEFKLPPPVEPVITEPVVTESVVEPVVESSKKKKVVSKK